MSIFSTTIKVPVSVLQETAKKIKEYADTNEDLFDRVYNSLEELDASGEWQGKSLQATMTATYSNKTRFENVVTELQSLADFMQKFADDMAEKDEEIKNSINAVG